MKAKQILPSSPSSTAGQVSVAPGAKAANSSSSTPLYEWTILPGSSGSRFPADTSKSAESNDDTSTFYF